jgi:hypothetical protein
MRYSLPCYVYDVSVKFWSPLIANDEDVSHRFHASDDCSLRSSSFNSLPLSFGNLCLNHDRYERRVDVSLQHGDSNHTKTNAIITTIKWAIG